VLPLCTASTCDTDKQMQRGLLIHRRSTLPSKQGQDVTASQLHASGVIVFHVQNLGDDNG
jgi:hypothetical protein